MTAVSHILRLIAVPFRWIGEGFIWIADKIVELATVLFKKGQPDD